MSEESDDQYDYFAWTKTGHLNLILGIPLTLVSLLSIVMAFIEGVDRSSLLGVVILGAIGVSLIWTGVGQVKSRRSRKQPR